MLLIILLVAIGDFFIGAIIGPLSDEEKARGFTGFSGTDNFLLHVLLPDLYFYIFALLICCSGHILFECLF